MAEQAQQMTREQAEALNLAIRNAVINQAVPMFQRIFTRSFLPSQEYQFAIPPRYVGLIRGFLVQVDGTITNGTGAALSLTNLGAGNLFNKIGFTDLSNTVRIQTTGWHVTLINSAKQPLVFGGAYAPNVPVGYGNNWTVMSAPSSIAASTDGVVRYFWYVPLAYSKNDLRGAVFAQVVNATATLNLELNQNPVVISTADPTLAVYQKGDATANAGWKAATNVTIQVYQDYLDQLPQNKDGSYLLPPIDMNTIYELKNTALQGFSVGQDFGIPYANYRTFLSTFVIYNNAGVLNTGSDVNYWSLQAANTTELFNITPEVSALNARNTFFCDLPRGVYYFDMRSRPINTQQFGNMQLVINAKTVGGASAVLLVGFEDFANITLVPYATSLPTGG